MDIVLNTRFDNPRLPIVQRPGFADDFNRAAGSTLSSTTDHKAWEHAIGQPWVIVSGGHASGLGRAATTWVDSMASDGVLTAVVGLAGVSDFRSGIVFRLQDEYSYIGIWPNTSGVLTLYVRESGSNINTVNLGSPWEAGDTVEVVLDGPQITISINGTTRHSFTESRFVSETAHGLISFGGLSDGTWDSVEFIAK